MNPSHRQKHEAGCVFYQDPVNEAYGAGHASFTKSPDGSQDWIVYHWMKSYATEWADRTIMMQEYSCYADGSLNFPS